MSFATYQPMFWKFPVPSVISSFQSFQTTCCRYFTLILFLNINLAAKKHGRRILFSFKCWWYLHLRCRRRCPYTEESWWVNRYLHIYIWLSSKLYHSFAWFWIQTINFVLGTYLQFTFLQYYLPTYIMLFLLYRRDSIFRKPWSC